MIDNPKSAPIKRAAALHQKKQRQLTKNYLIEGPHGVVETLRHTPAAVHTVYITPDCRSKYPELDRLADSVQIPLQEVTLEVAAALSDTVTPQGVVAVAKQPQWELPQILAQAKLIAIMVDVRDPGNAGTVLRAADAAGADGVIFAGHSIDPWHPKVVRATTGSISHIPVLTADTDTHTLLAQAATAGLHTIAAALTGADLTPAAPELQQRVAWVFGNEAHGLDSADISACDTALRLPIYGAAESLNLATAAAVCLYTTAFAQRNP